MSSRRGTPAMKKEAAVKPPEHPPMTEEKKLKETFSPGKSGGAFALPLDARIIVPDGIFVKRDTVTCRVVPPSERWRHSPNFPDEYLASEIFTLSGSSRMKLKPVILILPYYPLEASHMELNVKGMWKDELNWVDVGFIQRMDLEKPFVELQLERMGTFAVTFRRKTDQFQVGSNGGLIQSRLLRGLVIRFPKKAIESNISYNMKIESVAEERADFCRHYFPQDCHDLLVASQFIDLVPDLHCDFRRPSTLKIPLPSGMEVEGETSDEIVVLHKESGEWHAVDSKYKFTRYSVTFDIKNPSRFIVVKTKPGRQKKMQSAVAVLEQRAQWLKGQISVFLSLKEKSWMGFVEVFPQDLAQAKITARQKQGFTVFHKVEASKVATSASTASFSVRRPPSLREYQPIRFEGMEIYDGLTWTVEMHDDLQFGPESDLAENAELQFFQHVPENYRRFRLVPAMEDDRPLKGVLRLKPVGVTDATLREQLTLSFDLDIPAETVAKYHYVPEPEPEPEPVKSKFSLDLPDHYNSDAVVSPPKPALVTKRTFSVSALERLSQANRRITVPEKEAKVISGKSLMVLSRVVNEGLTLAVHLNLPDSTITGIGFDALSNNRSMSEVGYRILLYWKRTRKDKRDGAVQHLLEGLRSMGKHGVADIVEERHKENKELTMDCFLMAAVSGVSISN